MKPPHDMEQTVKTEQTVETERSSAMTQPHDMKQPSAMTQPPHAPRDFRYRDVLRRGKPVHAPLDTFSIRHPSMPLSRRAKIFSPFDALKGFNEAIAAKDISYVPKKGLDEETAADLDRRIFTLRNRIHIRANLEHPVRVSIEYFVPCVNEGDGFHTGDGCEFDTADGTSGSCDISGQYKTLTGICRGIDTIHRTITIDEQQIPADSISNLEILP